MAKSLRSKHKRRMRAVKRQRYALKELAILKKTVLPDDEVMLQEEDSKTTPVESTPVEENDEKETISEDKMETERKFDKKTKLDQFGSYPVWMNQRSIQKLKSQAKKKKKLVGKIIKSRNK